MFVNYYMGSAEVCVTCGGRGKPLHIGKSTTGWVFMLHLIPETDIHSLYDWVRYWDAHPELKILSEFDEEVSRYEMLSVITARAPNLKTSPVRDTEDQYLDTAQPCNYMKGEFC